MGIKSGYEIWILLAIIILASFSLGLLRVMYLLVIE